jgi:hypothetical protein
MIGTLRFMALRYFIDKQRRLVVVIGSGLLTAADLKAVIDPGPQDPDFNADFNEFVDLRAVTAIDLTADQIRMLAGWKLYSPTSKRAFLASAPHVFGVGRMWEAYAEFSHNTTQIRVFYELASALEWIGLESLPSIG